MYWTGHGRIIVLFLALFVCHCGGRQNAAPEVASPGGGAAVFATMSGPKRTCGGRTFVSLYALTLDKDAAPSQWSVIKKMSQHKLPDTIQQLEWIDRERLGILLDSGQVFVLQGGQLRKLPELPKSVWVLKNPGEDDAYQDYPVGAELIASEEGQLWLSNCPYDDVDMAGNCCAEWVYVNPLTHARRTKSGKPRRRLLPPPQRTPAPGVKIEARQLVRDKSYDMVSKPTIVCTRPGAPAHTQTVDEETKIYASWLGGTPERYLAWTLDPDFSGEQCDGPEARGRPRGGKIDIAKACEDAGWDTHTQIQWGPNGFWAYESEGGLGLRIFHYDQEFEDPEGVLVDVHVKISFRP